MTVMISEATVYEPDAVLRCGPPLPADAISMADPMVLVEVLSPATQARDTGDKLADYFRLPSVRHYLILRPGRNIAIHHARAADGAIATRILHEGCLTLDPPGITLDLADLFPPAA
jgi:Uma2 family endonuclease